MARTEQHYTQDTITPPQSTDVVIGDDMVTISFANGISIEIWRSHYDRQRRLWGEIVAKHGETVVNHSQINLLNQRDLIDFHQVAHSLDGQVNWHAHLLSVIPLLQQAMAAQEVEETGTAVMAPMGAPVLPFPVEVFPAPLARLIREGSKALPCPPEFIGVPMLPVQGIAIGTSRAIEVKPGWVEGPRINGAVVADPGSKKSPALALALAPLYARQEKYRTKFADSKKEYEGKLADFEIQEALWRDLLRKQEARREDRPQRPEEPTMAQIWTSDATLEALAELIERNPRGVLMARDELTGWVLSMNQYKGGKGADRQAWLSFWNGAPVIVNRKNRREPTMLSNPMVCVTGCLPPDVLSDLTDEQGREDGFVHRILFAWPDPVTLEYTDACVSDEAIQGYTDVIEKLLVLGSESANTDAVVTFTPSAHETFRALVEELYQVLNAPDCAPHLRGPIAKLEGYAARLALILQLTRKAAGETGEETIEQTSVDGAAKLVRYFLSHARRVYAQLRTTPEDKQVVAVMQWIRAHGTSTTARELLTNHVAGVKSASEAKVLLTKLHDRGYGRVKDGPGNRVLFSLHTT
jgi:hypothetical protein